MRVVSWRWHHTQCRLHQCCMHWHPPPAPQPHTQCVPPEVPASSGHLLLHYIWHNGLGKDPCRVENIVSRHP